MNTLENWVNAVNDWDLGWGPLLSWRPAKAVIMGTRLVLKYFVACVIGIYFGVFVLLIMVPFFLQQLWDPYRGTKTGTWVLHENWRILRDAGWWLSMGIPLYVFLLILPLVYFWNRRASRLTRSGKTPLSVSPTDAWPPPPSRPAA